MKQHTLKLLLAGTALSLSFGPALADQVILDDLIVDGSICAGQDCVNGESFGFDTLRLKENNLRIKFQDTSSTASFPSNDWQITANDSTNGGANKFSIDDVDNGRTPFTIEATAPSNSLFVDSAGKVGFGNGNPVVELHVTDGDTPTMRLEQDGSSGFGLQTWDVAGNEANFFVRDVTNGSQLSFRIRPGAPESSIDIAANGDVGLGTSSPDAPLELSGSESFNFMRITATGASPNTSVDITYTDGGAAGELRYNIVDGDGQEMSLDADGNMDIAGTLTTNGPSCGGGCDRVFDADYDLLSVEEHAALMWTNRHLPAVGPTEPGAPMNMTEKMGDMLNELEHAHIYIEDLHGRLKAQEDLNTDLLARIEKLEQAD